MHYLLANGLKLWSIHLELIRCPVTLIIAMIKLFVSVVLVIGSIQYGESQFFDFIDETSEDSPTNPIDGVDQDDSWFTNFFGDEEKVENANQTTRKVIDSLGVESNVVLADNSKVVAETAEEVVSAITEETFQKLLQFPTKVLLIEEWIPDLPPPSAIDFSQFSEFKPETCFSLFNRRHREIAGKLIKILEATPDYMQFLSNAGTIRNRINYQLFNYALTVAASRRSETKHFTLPVISDTIPYKFIDKDALDAAIERSKKKLKGPQACIAPIWLAKSTTENVLAYFREDIGLNLHHWYWHLIHPVDPHEINTTETEHKDRRGELFYYMHAQVIARYSFERVSNHLNDIEPFWDFREKFPDAYFPNINSAPVKTYSYRLYKSTLKDFKYSNDINVTIDELYMYKSRIEDAIKSRTVVYEKPRNTNKKTLDIDMLGNIIESTTKSPNRKYYGDLHNYVHSAIALSHDPYNIFQTEVGVMADTATAIRDPIFYRWHTSVNDLFRMHLDSLPSYRPDELKFNGIKINNVAVKSEQPPNRKFRGSSLNEFVTFWEESTLDISGWMNFTMNASLKVCQQHLQHNPFVYEIDVDNSLGKSQMGTVRIFLAPVHDGLDKPLTFDEQRRYFVELDKFVEKIKPGKSTIRRHSSNSSVTIPPEQTFQPPPNATDSTDVLRQFIYRGCGWPEYLLIPRGRPEGLKSELFVMISDYENGDKVPGSSVDLNDLPAPSLCGVKIGKLIPDRRTMGFPFDRKARVSNLKDFLTDNMFSVMTRIKFIDEVKRGNQGNI